MNKVVDEFKNSQTTATKIVLIATRYVCVNSMEFQVYSVVESVLFPTNVTKILYQTLKKKFGPIYSSASSNLQSKGGRLLSPNPQGWLSSNAVSCVR
jgi:hypothetical protein